MMPFDKTDLVRTGNPRSGKRSALVKGALQFLAGTGVFAAVVTYMFQNKEAEELQRELNQYKQELVILQRKYEDLLAEKAQASNRKTSIQLDILENQIKKDFDRKVRRHPLVEILGINGTGPLHQGRELFIKTLQRGGKVRFLLLDPQSQTFSDRSHFEKDTAGRIAAEELASFYILADIANSLTEKIAPNLEVRIFSEPLDRSLIMVDVDSDDGLIMENPYPKDPGYRGLSGEMFIWRRTSGMPEALRTISGISDVYGITRHRSS